MTSHSSGVKPHGLSRIWSGMPILPNVVHRAREKDLVNELFIQAEHPGKLAVVIADALHVSAGVFIFVFRRARHRENGFQIAFLKIGGPLPHSLFRQVAAIVQRGYPFSSTYVYM